MRSRFKRKIISRASRIKKVFQGWLSLFIIIGFIVMLCVSWKTYGHLSQKAAKDMLRIQLRYACTQIDQAQENLKHVTNQSNHGA